MPRQIQRRKGSGCKPLPVIPKLSQILQQGKPKGEPCPDPKPEPKPA